jgi:citrate synthase
MKSRTVTLTDNTTGKQVELPVHEGKHGPAAIDIRTLYKELGYFTYDPGFMSTASCSSAITYIDGDKGVLMYRGYPIEELAEHSTYMETCHLLFYGELPDADELSRFSRIIKEHSMLHEAIRRFYGGFRHDAHPMAIMVGVVGALSAFYHDNTDVHNPRTGRSRRTGSSPRCPPSPRGPTSTPWVSPSSTRTTIWATRRTS